MALKIEINTETLQPNESAALVAFLMTLHPEAASDAVLRLGTVENVDYRITCAPASSAADLRALETGIPAQPFDVEQHVGPEPSLVAGTLTDDGTTDGPALIAMTPEQAFGGTARPFASAPEATPRATAPAGTPAAPSPSTNTGPTATTAASPSDAELDAEGLPWDERIHSSNHKKSANGVWMKRRGVNQLVDQKVRAELRETYPAPTAETAAQRTLREAVADGLVSPPQAGSTAPAVAPPPPPTASAAPPPPASTPAAPPPPPPAASGDVPAAQQFADAMKVATAAQARGAITAADTIAIATGLGLTSLRDLVAPANAALIPQFRAGLDALIGERDAGGAA